MAQQTINVGAAPNDGTGTPLRTAFQYTNSNFTELYTALGGGSGLPGASGQLIFNNGTSLAGDNELFYNATTNTLTTEKLIVPGNTQVATVGTLYVGTILNPKLKVDVAGTGETTIASATINSTLTVNGQTALNTDLTVTTLGLSTLKVTAAKVGIGTSSPTETLHVAKTTATGAFARFQDSANTNYLGTDNGNFRITNAGASDLINIQQLGVFTFGDGAGGTRMTLNSTGLGVGGGPDTGLLTVGATTITSATTPSIRVLSNKATLVVTADGATNAAGTTINYSWANGGQGPLIFRNASVSNVMTLDASGNVGIGVTPSAWNSNYNALDIGQNGTISGRAGSSNTVDLASNGFRNTSGNWVYKLATSNTACRYQLDGSTGSHIWYSGAAGTAGNTIAGFSSALMTLDASGNLILQPPSSPPTLGTNGQLTVNATSNTNLRFSYRGSDGVTRVANITLA